jgi:hypothetical protein
VALLMADIKGPRGPELFKQYVKAHGERSIIAFSRGKDSLAMALALRGHVDVVPVHYYLIPNLPMAEESLDYFERKLFHRRILRYPDQRLYELLYQGAFLPMRNLAILEATPLRNPMHETGGLLAWRNRVRNWIIDQEGMDRRALIGVGVTARDSPVRWMSFQKHGAIRPGSGAFYPIWEYTRDMLLDAIRRSGLKLPIDYRLFGKSFDGLSAEYLVPIKRDRPQDWKVILEWFPLADQVIWHHERGW